MREKLAALAARAREQIAAAPTIAALKDVELRYLGRKGELTGLLRRLGELRAAERPLVGELANEIRRELADLVAAREAGLAAAAAAEALSGEAIDVTLPGAGPRPGKAHPLLRVWEEIEGIFLGMGFDVIEGREIETDFYNFEALNVPRDHPARDMQDSFYLAEDIVLRTQTSPVQIRMMRRLAPALPVRLVHLGRVYRRGDDDLTHSPMFHQMEGLWVDRGIGLQHLKGVLLAFARRFYGKGAEVRMRPSYFPFTEPSAEVDVTCAWCRGSGCRSCKGSGWIEILGAGMVHPNVLRHGGYDPEEVSGFAFGMGLDRQAQLRYAIDHINLMYLNDMRMLKQL